MSRGSDSFIAPDIAQRPANTPAKPSGDHIPLGGFVLTSMRPMMIADRHDHFRIFQSPKPEWAQIPHYSSNTCITQCSARPKHRLVRPEALREIRNSNVDEARQ
jgi:hypothetical protein